MKRNEKGQFIKGSGFWTGKKRPGLKTKSQFIGGSIPWNKGKSGTYKLKTNRKGKTFNTGKTHFKKGHTIKNPNPLRGVDHPQFGKARVDMYGVNNPNWNGGTTLLRDQIRKTMEYKTWRLSVFKRDNFSCQHCQGTREVRVILEADHLVPFIAIIKRNNIQTVEEALKCKELWDINNGRTLCHYCHSKTKTYLNKEEVRKYYAA